MPMNEWFQSNCCSRPAIGRWSFAVIGMGVFGGYSADWALLWSAESVGLQVATNASTQWYYPDHLQALTPYAPGITPTVQSGPCSITATVGGPWPNGTRGNGHELVMVDVLWPSCMDKVYAVATPATPAAGNVSIVSSTAVYSKENTTAPWVLVKQYGAFPADQIVFPVGEICEAIGTNQGMIVSIFNDNAHYNSKNFSCSYAGCPTQRWGYAVHAQFDPLTASIIPNATALAHVHLGSSVQVTLVARDNSTLSYTVNISSNGVPYFNVSPQNGYVFDPSAGGFFVDVYEDGWRTIFNNIPVKWTTVNATTAIVTDDVLASQQNAVVPISIGVAAGSFVAYGFLLVFLGIGSMDLSSDYKLGANRPNEAELRQEQRRLLVSGLIPFISHLISLIVFAFYLQPMPPSTPKGAIMALANTNFFDTVDNYYPRFKGLFNLVGIYLQLNGLLLYSIGLAVQMCPPRALRWQEVGENSPLLVERRKIFGVIAHEMPAGLTAVALILYGIQLQGVGAVALVPLVAQIVVGAVDMREWAQRTRAIEIEVTTGRSSSYYDLDASLLVRSRDASGNVPTGGGSVGSAISGVSFGGLSHPGDGDESPRFQDSDAAVVGDPEGGAGAAQSTPPQSPRAGAFSRLTDGTSPATDDESRRVLVDMAGSPGFLGDIGEPRAHQHDGSTEGRERQRSCVIC